MLQACKAGDPAAWEQLFRKRSAQIYRWAILLGLQPSEAEDAAQEVFMIATRRIETCRAEEAMTSWLFQITRRVVGNVRRSSWFKRSLFGDRPTEPAFDRQDPVNLSQELAVRQCLAKLPKAQVEALVLLEVDGLTREEIAEALGIPPGTVASRVRLAREAFRKAWEESSEPEEAGLSWGKR
nr:sigma-70 family RNA polymerase sigma factor [Vulgatibacter incomptus]